jgi:hypothetical protein
MSDLDLSTGSEEDVRTEQYELVLIQKAEVKIQQRLDDIKRVMLEEIGKAIDGADTLGKAVYDSTVVQLMIDSTFDRFDVLVQEMREIVAAKDLLEELTQLYEGGKYEELGKRLMMFVERIDSVCTTGHNEIVLTDLIKPNVALLLSGKSLAADVNIKKFLLFFVKMDWMWRTTEQVKK